MSVRVPERASQQRKTRIISSEPIIVKHLLLRGKYTPDFRYLRSFDRIPVFVYDDHQRQGLSAYIMEGSEYLGQGVTLTPFFKMFSAGREPIVFKETDSKISGRASVRGELYNVSVETLHVLDRELRNQDKVFRNLEKILMLDQEPDFEVKKFRNLPWIHAFMYTANKNLWLQSGGLKHKSTREDRSENSKIKNKPYFEWDAWESGWPDEFGMGAMLGVPYGNEFSNYPREPSIFDDDENFNPAEWKQDRFGAWHKIKPAEFNAGYGD